MKNRANIYRQLDQQFELEDRFSDTRELTQEDIENSMKLINKTVANKNQGN